MSSAVAAGSAAGGGDIALYLAIGDVSSKLRSNDDADDDDGGDVTAASFMRGDSGSSVGSFICLRRGRGTGPGFLFADAGAPEQ